MATSFRTSRTSVLLLPLFAGAWVLGACGAGGPSGNEGKPGELIDNGFESDDPDPRNAEKNQVTGSADAGTAAAAPAESANGAASDAQRAVEEADIIKVDGNKLYALSRYGGLAVIDVSDPDHMHLLGRKRVDGTPFEMYVRNGRAYVMLNEFGRYVRTAASVYGQWVQTSEIVALDVENPASIGELAHYDVPGSIADSRLVGDALYLVTYENGYCYGCQQQPATIVTSFNVAGASIAKVDNLKFGSGNTYSWQRSVAATNQRLYIAGPEYNWQPGQVGGSSTIQVVDITDPGGALKPGAEVTVAGQINSRWQIDESAGVLRVVSQFNNGWSPSGATANPKVQTFTVASSTSITPLGSTEIKLPHPEQLNSVRFDGARAYAITSERKDPLFTIDLSNPAQPKQAAALEMPGWIFYMEPRGDRLVGFGYDDTMGSAARLAVSLFDVADLAQPKLLSRVSFGSGWGTVAEDMDRIHKSVQVLDQAGLVLVPFASYGRWNGASCSSPESGIQLIDYSHDGLTLRGVAPQWGMPRRAVLANNRLLAVSDRTVTSFDIGARDNPVKKNEIDLSTPAYRTVELPNHVAAISSDWWSGEVVLSLTPRTNPDDADVTGKLSLASLAPSNQTYCNGPYSWTSWYQARLLANGNFVYLTVPVYSYDGSSSSGKVIVAAIDTSDPAHPVLSGKVELPLTEHKTNYGYYGGYSYFWDGYGYYSYYGGYVLGSGDGVIAVGSKIAYLEVDNEYVPTAKLTPYGSKKYELVVHRKLHVADMANPQAPQALAPIDLGESLGSAPLHVLDGVALSSRWVKSTVHPGKVRFFVDRVDLNGAQPALLSSVNTPGSLLLADPVSHRLVTTDYAVSRNTATDWTDCQKNFGWNAYFDYETKECTKVARAFKLADLAGTKVSLLQTFTPPSQNIGGIAVTDDRIYITRQARYDYTQSCGATPSGGPCTPKVIDEGGLWVLGGIRSGTFDIVSQMTGDARWPLAVHGTKAALYTEGGLAIYDSSTPTPSLVTEVNLRGYGYSSYVLMTDDHAVASLGEYGLQTIKY